MLEYILKRMFSTIVGHFRFRDATSDSCYWGYAAVTPTSYSARKSRKYD